MRHRCHTLRLKQKPGHARMMQRNLLTSLLLYESIRTTKNRAKVIQPLVDRVITYAKKRPPHVAVRYINRYVTHKNASRKIMEVYKDRYKTRSSGLSRITPVGARQGDGADLVDLTLVDAVIGAAPVVTETKEEVKAEPKPKAAPKTKAPDVKKKPAPKAKKATPKPKK